MRTIFTRLVCCVILLAMLAVPMTALVSAEGEAPAGETYYKGTVGYDSATGWKDANRDCDWATSNKSDNDGWTGGIMWYKEYTFDAATKELTLITKGVSGTDGAHPGVQYIPFRTWHYADLKYDDGKAETSLLNGTTAFSAQFDINFAGKSFTVDGLLTVGADGLVKTNAAENNEVGTLAEGWNTIKMFFIANTDEAGAVTSWNYYTFLNPAPVEGLITASEITAGTAGTWAKTALTKNHVLFLKWNDESATAENPVSYTVRNFHTERLDEAEVVTVDFGGAAAPVVVEKGAEITFPEATFVENWTIGETTYNPGDKLAVSADTSVTPNYLKTTYKQTVGYDSATGWKDANRDCDWATSNKSDNDGWTGGIMWYKEYTWDAATKELTLISKKSGGHSGLQYIPYRTWHYADVKYNDGKAETSLLSGATMFSAQFDYKYEGTGFRVDGAGLTIADDGTVKTNTGNVVGTMTEGWNTIKMYFVANTDDAGAVTGWNYYAYLNPAATGDLVTTAAIAGGASGTWNKSGLGTGHVLFLKWNDGKATEEAPLHFSVRNFKTVKLEAAETVTASFGGATDPIVVAKGAQVTLPAAPFVYSWKLGDTVYAIGDKVTLDADTTFEGLTTLYTQTIGYDSDIQWTNQDVKENGYGNCSKGDGGGWTPGIMWYNKCPYTFDKANKELTLRSEKAGGNGMQLYIYRTYTAGYGTTKIMEGATAFWLSFDFKYVAEGFTGFRVDGVANINADGTVKTNTGNDVGKMVEGWNTIKIYAIANTDAEGAVTSWNTYVALNPAATETTFSANEISKCAAGTWNHKKLTDAGSYFTVKFNDSTATAEAPLSYTMKNFKIAKLNEAIPATVTFDGKADEITNKYVGDTITLPTVDGLAGWNLGDVYYACGASYTIGAANVAFTATTPAQLADQALPGLSEAVLGATAGSDEYVTAALALQAALANEILDKTTTNYTFAANVMNDVYTSYEKGILDNLVAPDDEEEPETREQVFARLQKAIVAYQRDKVLVREETKAKLVAAIDEYNAFVEKVNADVVDAATVAVAVSVYKVANTEIVAILADIKSKVED